MSPAETANPETDVARAPVHGGGGLLEAATLDEVVALMSAAAAHAEAGVRLAQVELQLFRNGMQKLLQFAPLLLLLLLSLWGTLLFGVFLLIETYTGSAISAWAGVASIQVLLLGLGLRAISRFLRHAFFPLTRKHLVQIAQVPANSNPQSSGGGAGP